jgi:hypothetical protein
MPRSRLVPALWVFGLLASQGCVPGYMRIELATTRATNGGAPLYLLVRAVDTKQYATQTYSKVADLLEAPDASVVRTQLLYPGRSYRFYMRPPAKESVGMYFLFAAPGGPWSVLLPQPLPLSVHLSLGDNIIRQQVLR